MSVQEIKKALTALSKAERAEVAAFLFHLRHADDEEYQQTLERRLSDKDPAHWVPLAEFEKRLNET